MSPAFITMLSTVQENHGTTVGQLAVVAFVFLTASLLSSFVVSYFRPGLHELPGPVLARFTLLWKVWVHIKGDGHVVYQNIHKRYGPIVRTGPNSVSIGEAAMIPEIYLSGHSYLKVGSPSSCLCIRGVLTRRSQVIWRHSRS